MLLDPMVHAEVVHWRFNCFSVLFGKTGRDFVRDLSRLYLAFRSASVLEAITLKAATVSYSTPSETKQKGKDQRSYQVLRKEIT